MSRELGLVITKSMDAARRQTGAFLRAAEPVVRRALRALTAKRLAYGALGAAVASALVVSGVAAGAALERDQVFARAATKLGRMWTGLVGGESGGREADVRPVARRQLSTTLFDLEEASFSLGPFSSGMGGSIAQYEDGVIFVEPTGWVGYVSLADGRVRYIGDPVPMNRDKFVDWMEQNEAWIIPNQFRAMDSLVTRDEAGTEWLYVSHQRLEDRCVVFVISRIAIEGGEGGPSLRAGGWEEVWVGRPCVKLPPDAPTFQGMQSGGRMVEIAPGRLLVSIGDFAFDGVMMTPPVARDPEVDLGKIIELDVATGEASFFSVGHRNPQGLAVASDGRVWATEHGPKGGDELNLITRGGDYGWPATTFGLNYGAPRADWPGNREQGRHDESYVLPKLFYAPSIGLSNLIEAPSTEFPLWRGDLLVGSLEGMTLHRLRLGGEAVLSDEPIVIGERIRDVIALTDGRVVLLTDGGGIRVLERKRPESERAPYDPLPTELTGFAELAAARRQDPVLRYDLSPTDQARRLFAVHCASCHSMDGRPGVGPDLRGIMSREVASVSGYDYSPALRDLGGRWNDERLLAFIADPQKVAPGTKMSAPGVNFYDIDVLFTYFYQNP